MPKRTLQGVVVSDKQDKTVIVRVERRFTHPVMKKTVRRSNKFHAHDEKNEFSIGDLVWIEEHKPISKLKRWAVIRGEKRAGDEPKLAAAPAKSKQAKTESAKTEGGKPARVKPKATAKRRAPVKSRSKPKLKSRAKTKKSKK